MINGGVSQLGEWWSSSGYTLVPSADLFDVLQAKNTVIILYEVTTKRKTRPRQCLKSPLSYQSSS